MEVCQPLFARTKQQRLTYIVWMMVFAFTQLQTESVFAQSEATDTHSINERYNAANREAIDQNRELIKRINADHRAELKAYREENSKRAQSVSNAFSAANRALSEAKLSRADRQSKQQQIQADDKQRRLEYAQWRNETATAINQKYRDLLDARRAEHKANMDQILKTRNSALVALKANTTGPIIPIGTTSNTPGTNRPPDESESPNETSDPIDEPVIADEPAQTASTGATTREPGQLRHRVGVTFVMISERDIEVREWSTLRHRLPLTFTITGIGDAATTTFGTLKHRIPITLTLEGTSP